MAQDRVELDPQQVANGLGRWDEVAATLRSRWTAINGQIAPLLTEASWGGDEAGSAFRRALMDEMKAGEFAERGVRDTPDEMGAVVQVERVGENVRRAAEASLAADEEQAAEVGRVNPSAGFNSGGGGGGSGGGSSSGGSAAMMSSGGSAAGSDMMAEMVPGSGTATSEMVMQNAAAAQSVPSSGSVATWEMVQEDAPLGGPSDQDITYQRQPIGDTQSPYRPPGDETQVAAGPGGRAPYSTDGTTSERVYDDPSAGNGESAEVSDVGRARESVGGGEDRMTTQPVDEDGSAQTPPQTGPGERGQDTGPRGNGPDGPAESLRERIAERIPDRVVSQLPDGLAERIYEARGDYNVEVGQANVEGTQVAGTQGLGNPGDDVHLTDVQLDAYLPRGDQLTVEQPR